LSSFSIFFVSVGQLKYSSFNEKREEKTCIGNVKRHEEKKEKEEKKMNGCVTDVLRSTG
jgi:hypothetical protein